jgi:hypothetical protein
MGFFDLYLAHFRLRVACPLLMVVPPGGMRQWRDLKVIRGEWEPESK